jgi:hydroxyacylglutathione hydrolase
MTLVPLPAFADNYIWMLHDGSHAIVVDPGDAQPVFDALARHKLQLAAILVTHHHADHTGGVAALHAATGAPVWGPARERIPEPFTPLAQGDVAEVLGLRFQVIDVPGHTAGHIAYFLPALPDSTTAPSQAPLLFCGDTLFSGRLRPPVRGHARADAAFARRAGRAARRHARVLRPRIHTF